MIVVLRLVEVVGEQFLKQIHIGWLRVEDRLAVEVILDDFFAAVGVDGQTYGCQFVLNEILHEIGLDVGHFLADGGLNRVEVARLTATVNLVEMLYQISVYDFFGEINLMRNTFVACFFDAYGRLFLVEIGNVVALGKFLISSKLIEASTSSLSTKSQYVSAK